jgi:N utilization substance protein B
MKSRHQARIVALQNLYSLDVELMDGESVEVSNELATVEANLINFEVELDVQQFVMKLVSATRSDLKSIDESIVEKASNWRMNRMGAIDRNILRMALAELRHIKETPPAVVINEAIELAKEFGDADSARFVNGVLDSFVKSLLP